MAYCSRRQARQAGFAATHRQQRDRLVVSALLHRTVAVVALALVALLASPFASASPATAAPSASKAGQASRLWELLQAPHPQVDAKVLARIGPDVMQLLIETATAPRIDAPVRLRALGWLQWYPCSASKAVLMEALRARSASVGAMRVALRALAVGFGGAALPVLGEHLLHRDALVREAAAYALGDVDQAKARSMLDDRLEREPELAVRDAIVAAVQRHVDRATARANR